MASSASTTRTSSAATPTAKVETHALWVANPPNGRILPGPPQDWPALFDWEDVFDDEPDADGVTEDDRYGETGPLRPAAPCGMALVTSDGPAAESEARRSRWASEIGSRGEQEKSGAVG